MFLDEDLPKKKSDAPTPRNLESMSVAELHEYIAWLKGEIVRTEADIKKKQAASAAADGFFKK
jgi:uncharacterized small protein (DUF1192 family)